MNNIQKNTPNLNTKLSTDIGNYCLAVCTAAFYCDFSSDSMQCLKAGSCRFDSYGSLLQYISNNTASEERHTTLSSLEPNNILQTLHSSGSVNITLCNISDSNTYRLTFIPGHNENCAILLIRSISQDAKKDSKKSASRLSKNKGSMYVVNKFTYEYKIIAHSERVRNKYEGAKDFNSAYTDFANKYVHEADRERFLAECSLAAMAARLEHTDTFEFYYRSKLYQPPIWFLLKAANYSKDQLLISFEEKNTEYIFSKLDEHNRNSYYAVFYVNTADETLKVIKKSPYDDDYNEGDILPFQPVMQKIAGRHEYNTHDFLESISSLDNLCTLLQREKRLTYFYHSSFAENKWVCLTVNTIAANADGVPENIALCFSLLDSDAGKRMEYGRRLETATKRNETMQDIMHFGSWSFSISAGHKITGGNFSPQALETIRNDIPDPENWTDLIHPDDREHIIQVLYDTINSTDSDAHYDEVFKIQDRDGNYRWNHSAGKMIHNSDGTGELYGITADINDTVIKQAKEAEALKQALHAAQAADRSKAVFLNNISHDIRTPMNAVIGFTDLAISHIDSQEQVSEYLNKIRSSSAYLLLLINDILDMSRIGSGKLQINNKQENLTEIIRNILDMLQNDVSAKKHSLSADTADIKNEAIICDAKRLKQVLLNILTNAVKFTPEGGTISMTVTEAAAADSKSNYKFIIRDNGIGIDSSLLDEIFAPFERAESATLSGASGTGLGLSVTKNIVDLMNGTIAVDSEKGKGTTVTISFDFEHCCQKSAQAQGYDFSGKRLLLVEDNELNMEIAEEILTEYGFEVDTAQNGKIAVDILKEAEPGKYAAVLMDIQMPVMDGYEASKAVRALEGDISDIPILAMTANAFDADSQKAAGMNAYIAKPINIDRLLNTLAEFV